MKTIDISVEGVTCYCHITYDEGGYNVWNNTDKQRGYCLVLQRRPNSFVAFKSVLDDPQGSSIALIKPVGRRSQKTLQSLEDNLEAIAKKELEKFISLYKNSGRPIYYDDGRYE